MPLRVRYVVPSFQQGRFLRVTLDSLLGQDLPGLDVVVCDGGSRDESVEVLRSFADPRLRWVSEQDRGQTDAIQKGLRFPGDYEYFNWLGSDDVLLPGAARTLVEAAERTGADVVFGEGDFIDPQGAIVGRYRLGPTDPAGLRERCPICQPAALIRRATYERVGGVDGRWNSVMDYDLWLRLSDAGARFVRLDATLAQYRLHPGSKTVSQRRPTYDELFRLFSERGERVSLGLYDLAFGERALGRLDGTLHLPVGPARVPWTLAYRALRTATRWPGLQRRVPAVLDALRRLGPR